MKQPWLAGILAFLLPGAGHLYQERFFKAAVYAVCILGLFLTGMAMAEWKAVQPPPKGKRATKVHTLKYTAQAAVGLPALYGLVQRERYYGDANQRVEAIDSPFSAPFEGEFRDNQGHQLGRVEGTVHLEPAQLPFGGRTIAGRLEGVLEGEPVTFRLAPHVELGKPIEASRERMLVAAVVAEHDGRDELVGRIDGSIPRPFRNWFQAPLDDHQEQELHRRLGKYHELAMVLTWIAGLLNVLAIWDAVEGPAYGYGDEGEQADTDEPPSTPPAD